MTRTIEVLELVVDVSNANTNKATCDGQTR
jgi:hypothetical protein